MKVHLPLFRDSVQKATYVGPLSAWKGKTALLYNVAAVQFEDRGQYTAYGWHLFNRSDWKVPETGPLYEVLAQAIQAQQNCVTNNNTSWFGKWYDFIEDLVKDHFPKGSGFDNGTTLEEDFNPERLVFDVSFHHMNENGMYDGWTDHQVIVTPSLSHGCNLRITGPNRNEIKDYIHDVFTAVLHKKVERYPHHG